MRNFISNQFLVITVFITGMSIMAIEFTAGRLIATSFGTSNLVWACIVGLILVFLAVGNKVGGIWADRSPQPVTLFTIIAWSGFLAALVPLFGRPVLRLAAAAFDDLAIAILAGSFASIFALLALPVFLMGMVSPFAVRLSMLDSRQAGRVSGNLSSVATYGSVIGTFLPDLLLVALLGVSRTFLLFSAILVVWGLVGMLYYGYWKRALAYSWMPAALVLILVFGLRGNQKNTPGQIYETESSYNYIEVLERDGYTLLRLNEGQGVHSVYSPDILDYRGPWEQFLAAPFFNPDFEIQDMERIAIVGLAAGTFARQATIVYGPVPIDGFEIDPKIIEVGQRYFDMNMPNLNPVAQDGRWGLEHSDERYTIIGVDAYRPPYIPPHLTSQEFFSLARDRLTDNGVLVINVGRSTTDRRLVEDLSATLGTVFPSVFVMDVAGSFNSIIYATVQPTEMLDLVRNFARLDKDSRVHPLLLESLRRVIMNQQPTPSNGTIYTDDLAPIEWITNGMVLSFIFSTEMESLPK